MRDRAYRLRLIHAARRQLGLDETAYRALLAGAAGVSSAGDMTTDRQWAAAVRALRAAGWRGVGRLQGQEAAAYALWRRLYDLGAVERRSYSALRSWVRRMLGGDQDIVHAAQWATVIESLRQWIRRVEAQANNSSPPSGTSSPS